MLRVADRELEDVLEPPGPEVAEQEQPAAERPRHAGGEHAGPGNQLVAELVEALDRRRGGCDALAAERERLAALGRPETAGTSPPGPFRCGSTTWSTKPVATAASNALPPRSSTAIPVCDASQCVDATIPKVPRSSGRVVKRQGRTTKYALNGSCSRRCTSTEVNPASARSSRAFCSPHIAPSPSPPCASDTVMQCMHEIM